MSQTTLLTSPRRRRTRWHPRRCALRAHPRRSRLNWRIAGHSRRTVARAQRSKRIYRAVQRGSRVQVGRAGCAADGLFQAASAAPDVPELARRPGASHRQFAAAGRRHLCRAGLRPQRCCARKKKRLRLHRCSSAPAPSRPRPWRSRRSLPRRASPPMPLSIHWPLARPRRRPNPLIRLPCKTGKTRKRRS